MKIISVVSLLCLALVAQAQSEVITETPVGEAKFKQMKE